MKIQRFINRILSAIGIKVIKAKRSVKKAGYRCHVPIEDARTPVCTVAEATRNNRSGKTHYVGDSCPGGHVDASPTQDNNITGSSS